MISGTAAAGFTLRAVRISAVAVILVTLACVLVLLAVGRAVLFRRRIGASLCTNWPAMAFAFFLSATRHRALPTDARLAAALRAA